MLRGVYHIVRGHLGARRQKINLGFDTTLLLAAESLCFQQFELV